jgi:hypothetical protein
VDNVLLPLIVVGVVKLVNVYQEPLQDVLAQQCVLLGTFSLKNVLFLDK